MEDFYWFEDPAGGEAEASGKIEVGGKTVNFHASAYGACYNVNINGTLYPEFCGGPGDWTYRYTWAFHRAGDPEPVHPQLPKDDPSVQVADRIEALRRVEAEPPDDPITAIAQQVEITPGNLEDEDEFEDTDFETSFFHVVNGRKIQIPIDVEHGEDDKDEAYREFLRQYIKELPVKKKMPRPPLPKYMHRTEDAYITDPKTGRMRANPDYKY